MRVALTQSPAHAGVFLEREQAAASWLPQAESGYVRDVRAAVRGHEEGANHTTIVTLQRFPGQVSRMI